MKKKKVRINFGNLFIVIVIFAFIVYGILFLYHKLNSDNTTNDKNNNDIKSEVTSTDKKLESLGYSKKERETISNNLSSEVILSLDKKYDNLDKLSSVKYFHIENIDRYEEYMNKENDYETVVMNVNIGLDREFYTNIKEVSDPYDTLVLVNKYYALPSGIEPKNLVNIEGEKMTPEAAEAMKKMISDLRSTGLTLNLISGYRSEDTQRALYNRYGNSDGFDNADTYSARPNHSEHQTGLAMDVSEKWDLTEEFENTEQFKWLNENAYKYGYILRYKKDKVYMTGYTYEPWHYRYVGVEAATIIKNENLTFEEYYVKYKGLY